MAKAAYDISGAQVVAGRDYPIATTTAIVEGTFVKLSAGLVVQPLVGETGAILGIAAENHSGVADMLNVRSNGTKIRVFDSPSLVHRTTAPQATATGGSTTTMAASALASFADDDFNGGVLKLISKVAASTNTDPIGTEYPITDFTASSKTFTFASAGGAITAGDVFAIFPPVGFAKGNLDSAFGKYDLTATASLAIKTVGMDIKRNVVYTEATLHANGNKAS